MKKTRLSLAVAGLVFAAGLIFTGCPKPTDGGSTVTHDENAKATDLIKFNFDGAKALGTVFKASGSRSARAAGETSEQLVKFDTNGNSDSVMENAIAEQKIDYSTLSPILEIKKNPYSTILEAAKGTYVTFKERNFNIKYTDGAAAPYLAQLIYAKRNGTIVDVSGQGMIIPKDDREYIEFANSGKAFFLMWVQDGNTENYYEKIMCFDPSTESTSEIFANSSKFDIGDFRINEDGSWMFVIAYDKTNTTFQKGILHIYAFPTANPSAKQELFTPPEGIATGAEKIGYDPASNLVFINIYDEDQDMLFGQRIYKWNNGYSATNGYYARRLFEYVIPTWYVEYTKEYKMTEDEAFEKIATNIKNQCGLVHNDYNGDGTGTSDDIEINLSFFKDKSEYSELYNATAKDGAAIKILFNNIYTQGFDGYTKKPGEERDGEYFKDKESQFYKFLDTYGKYDGYNGKDILLQYPLDKLCFLKDSDGKATTTPAVEDIDDVFYGIKITELLSTKYGSWSIEPMGIWEGSEIKFMFSLLHQLSDNNGNIIFEIPESIQNDEKTWIDFNKWGGYWGWTPAEAGATEDNPILYHFPFAASEEGVALVSRDRKDIFYIDAQTTQARKLLTGKNMDNIEFIYTITCENDMVFYTAKTTDGKWVNEGIKLSDNSLYTLKETSLLSSIVGM